MQNVKFLSSPGILNIPEPPLSTCSQNTSPHAEVALSDAPTDAGHHECVVNRFLSIAHPLYICLVAHAYEVLILRAIRTVNHNRPRSVAFLSWLLLLSNFPFFGTSLCQSLADQCSHPALI